MKIHTIAVGPLQENTYLVVDEDAQRAVFIDPGAEPERLLRALDATGAKLDAIWLTHSHMDHVGAIAEIVRQHPVPIFVHPDGQPVYRGAAEHARYFGLEIEQPPPADATLGEGDTLTVGGTHFQVIHTPGHEPGHVVIHGNGVAFVGDCLFAGSVGRTDLPMASGPELARSLERIVALGDDVKVYPGHGPATTIRHERRHNPFLNGSVRIAGSP
ncbi:MAG TPA: MBL fold metallo-hydrolase [Gemmatimonadaceae bacterium]|nr:MBL fold metallo-hydrolase [Gemmatimonadaceae bacterium]